MATDTTRMDAAAGAAVDYTQFPDARGHFGVHGGRFVSETLMAALEQLEHIYNTAKADPEFWKAFQDDLVNYVGRPTPLYHADRKSVV